MIAIDIIQENKYPTSSKQPKHKQNVIRRLGWLQKNTNSNCSEQVRTAGTDKHDKIQELSCNKMHGEMPHKKLDTELL